MRLIRMVVALFLAATAVGDGSLWAEEIAPVATAEQLEEHVEVHLRTWRVRVEPTRAAEPGECRQLGLEDLEVKLRDRWLDREHLIELDRELKPNLHALLLDMSGSMHGREEKVRHAAGEYVKQLKPDEKALIITFDENVVLAQSPTGDRAELIDAIDRIRLAGMTSINDGLYFAIHELDSHDLRPVIVLMTDGQDTGSIHRMREILELIDSRPDLTVFIVGLPQPSMRENVALPAIAELSSRSNGKMFISPGWHLEHVFLQIRDLLNSEALLTVNDPEPDAALDPIKVRARGSACKVKPFRTEYAFRETARMRPPFPKPPTTIPFPPGPLFRDFFKERSKVWADARCGEGEIFLDELWFLRVSGDRIQGCSVDITMEKGLLYRPWVNVVGRNHLVVYKTRWFDMRVPPFEGLPIHPVEVMDELAEFAISVADTLPDTLVELPPETHARPYHDYPSLMNGHTLFDARTRLAKALFVVEDYRVWLMEKLQTRSDEEFIKLKAKFQRIRPDLDPARIDAIARSSAVGTEILAKADGPSDADLRGHLSAWIGDIEAHDLFVRWEQRHVNRLIERARDEAQIRVFSEGWRELRRVFYLPSYARVLTLFAPFFDPDGERVGFWRVVLPRPGWMGPRLAQASVPLDLVPDRPFGYWLMDRLFRDSPAVLSHMRDRGYRVADLRYELLIDEKDRDPLIPSETHDELHGFRNTRVTILLDAPGSAESKSILEVTAHLRLGRNREQPEIAALRFSTNGDAELHELLPE